MSVKEFRKNPKYTRGKNFAMRGFFVRDDKLYKSCTNEKGEDSELEVVHDVSLVDCLSR